jgi:hypothetical protein
VHRGVYAVGHGRLTPDGRRLAAVLTGGLEATLFQRSAAALLDLRCASRGAVDIATPTRRGRTRPGIRAHAADLHPSERVVVRGIPCTSVARTLLDCADVLDRRSLERMCEQAEILRVFDLAAIRRTLDRANGRKGAALLDAVLQDLTPDKPPSRNEFERDFLRLCEEARVPPPRVNAPQRGIELDFLWPDHNLIVETDGYKTHGTRGAFERDRERDRRLVIDGWRVVRFTWLQVTRRPQEVTEALQALLRPS